MRQVAALAAARLQRLPKKPQKQFRASAVGHVLSRRAGACCNAYCKKFVLMAGATRVLQVFSSCVNCRKTM